jgi:eukaryotic-like serine/threonine-protein kinase
MGAIFAAEHLATEQRVALKVLWPHVLGSTTAVESFQLEGRITARLGSDHIVRVLDAGFDEGLGVPFLSMELLRGLTLRALVGAAGALVPAEALFVLRQVASALDKAHTYVDRDGRAAPIVHRDLKPENVFISVRERADVVVKVLDFGLAKVLSESHAHSHEIKGTPLFMAREQFSHGTVTPQIDVWALGLIAFYVLAGRVYWLSGTEGSGGVTSLLNEILLLPSPPPTERAAALDLPAPWPAGFDAWFLRCLEHDPQRRFASAGKAIEALVEIFAEGAGLTEAAIAEAGAALHQKVAGALGPAHEAGAGAADATSPPVSATRLVGTGELLFDQAPGSATASGATEGVVASALTMAQPRRAFPKGVALGAACVALGVAAWLGGANKKPEASRGEVGSVAVSAAPVPSATGAAVGGGAPAITAASVDPEPPVAAATEAAASVHPPARRGPAARGATPSAPQGAASRSPLAPPGTPGAKGRGDGRQEEVRPAPPAASPAPDIYSEP